MSGTLAEHNERSQFRRGQAAFSKPNTAVPGSKRVKPYLGSPHPVINDANRLPPNKARTPRYMGTSRETLEHKPRSKSEMKNVAVYGSPDWKHRALRGGHKHRSSLPLAVYGKKNGRDFYYPHDSCAPKQIDSTFVDIAYELDPRESITSGAPGHRGWAPPPVGEEEPPYPLNRGHDYMKRASTTVPQQRHRASGTTAPPDDWHGHIVRPELFSAVGNPLRLDSTLVNPCPRGPQNERQFPGNAINREPTSQQQIVIKASEGLVPHCFRHTDSKLSSKYSIGWKKTPYETQGVGQESNNGIVSVNQAVAKGFLKENKNLAAQLRWLDPQKFKNHFMKRPDRYGRRSEPGLLPQGASNFDSTSLSIYDITKHHVKQPHSRRKSHSHSFQKNPSKQMCQKEEMALVSTFANPGGAAKARKMQSLHGGRKCSSDEAQAYVETMAASRAQTPAA